MPAKAKLTTRSISTTTVTTDSVPKNASLTNSELDSNFLNLRDQTIAISAGGSSSDVTAGQTITVTGTGGISVSQSNRTVTIDGSAVSGGGGGANNPAGQHHYNTITMTTSPSMTATFFAGHDNFHFFKITNQPTSVTFNKAGTLPSRCSMTIFVWNAGSGTVNVSFPGIQSAGNYSIGPSQAILYRVFALQDAIGDEKLWFQPSGASVSYP